MASRYGVLPSELAKLDPVDFYFNFYVFQIGEQSRRK